MSQLKRVTLRLARNPDAGVPEGDPHTGYTLVAPIDAEGSLDPAAWGQQKSKCKVVRFSPETDARADGWLTHRGSHWAFHYDEDSEGGDEGVFRLGEHKFQVGEYVTITDDAGVALAYRISDINPA